MYSDGNISEASMAEATETCFIDHEMVEQRNALTQLASMVKVQNEVVKHVEALLTLADDIGIAVVKLANTDVRLAYGAYPPAVSELEQQIADATADLESTLRVYADVLATTYGIDA
jgi:hypothetical protein